MKSECLNAREEKTIMDRDHQVWPVYDHFHSAVYLHGHQLSNSRYATCIFMTPATVLIRKFLIFSRFCDMDNIGIHWKVQGLKSLKLFLYSSVCLNTWRGFLVDVFKLLGVVLSFKWIWLLFMCCRVASST